VILITSPNNPTGNSIAPKDLEKILKATGNNTLVVLDEAYYGFDEHYDEKSPAKLLRKYGNLVILRSFSKRYALAGLRTGFALWGKYAKNIIGYEDLYLGGNRLAESAAIATLDSDAYYKRAVKTIVAERNAHIKTINGLHHFKAYDSNANFFIVKADKKAMPVLEKELNGLAFAVSKFVTPEFMRISVAPRKYMQRFLEILEKVDGTIQKR
jgi:histidinol-phosphate aminotransferase